MLKKALTLVWRVEGCGRGVLMETLMLVWTVEGGVS